MLTALFPSQTPNPKLPNPTNNQALGELFTMAMPSPCVLFLVSIFKEMSPA